MSTKYEYDPEFIQLYEQAEFEGQYHALVTDGLRRIDRAPDRLISAQNELVQMLGWSNDATRDAFKKFYLAGGVTAADWERFDHTQHAPSQGVRGGQLRVVRS